MARITRKFTRLLGPLAACALVLGFTAPAPAPKISDADVILVRLAGVAGARAIQDSKWGMVGALQEAINAWAPRCGLAPIARDGFFGKATAAAAQAVAACRGARSELSGPHLTVETWQAVTGAPPPGALERARILARSMEGTDYDELEWNVCTSWAGDRGSVLTWGPYGKTLGWGGEILAVLRRVDPSLVADAFVQENAQGLDELLALKTKRELGVESQHAYPGARALMQRICKRPGQMSAWRKAFARLGAHQEVRDAYEEVAWGDSAWFRYVVERLTRAWREAGLEPSEVDHAFFVDRSIHMGWGANRFAAVEAALAAAKASDPERFGNARGRLAVAAAVTPKARPEDRAARDAIFLIDAEEELAPLMGAAQGWPADWRAMWAQRAGISAADLGLSDDRPAPGFDDHLRAGEDA